MATIVVTRSSDVGAVPTYAAASGGGDTLPNDGNTVLHVKNGGGSSITATVTSNKKCDQGFLHDDVVAVAAGAEKVIGPFNVGRFGRNVAVTYSAVTTVTVAAVSS
jgi:hypothetical protein